MKSVDERSAAKAQDLDAPRSTRGPRKLTARRKLITAAYDVMSRNGFEGSTLAQIIETAGVGVGSFYNHFSSKEDLAKAVFAHRAEEFGASLAKVAVEATNIAAATCYAFRRLLEEVEYDAVWASFILQLEPAMQMLDGLLRDHARKGLMGGVESGELKIDNVEAGITAIHGMMFAVAKAMLNGALSPEDAHGASVYALRMYGVEEAEARRLSRMPMAALRRELNQPALPRDGA